MLPVLILAGGLALVASSPPGARVVRLTRARVTKRPQIALGTLEPYRKALERAADGNGVPVALLAALSLQETRTSDPRAFRQEPVPGWIANGRVLDAARQAGWTNEQLSASYGLTQTLGATAWALGHRGRPEGLYDPGRSLELGARYLAQKLKRWKRDDLALIAYNGGDSAARAVLAGSSHKAQGYAREVLARRDWLQRTVNA